MPWIWITIAVVAILGIVFVGVVRTRRVGRRELTSQEWTSAGVVFFGAGVALWISAGPTGIGLMAVGAGYLFMGIRTRQG